MDRERGSRRTVRCGLHGRFYDSWSAAGCPDCAKRSPFSRARGRGWSAALLLLAGAAGLAHWQGRVPILSNTIRIEPAPALAPPLRPPVPRADFDVQALERFAEALDSLLAEGRRELTAIGKPSASVDSASAAGGSATAWEGSEGSRDWAQRVSRTCADAPVAPAPDADLEFWMAYEGLGEACHQLRLAAAAPGKATLPARSWRQASLDQAAARIAEARVRLGDAGRS